MLLETDRAKEIKYAKKYNFSDVDTAEYTNSGWVRALPARGALANTESDEVSQNSWNLFILRYFYYVILNRLN